jgi:Peptidase_C39 like family
MKLHLLAVLALLSFAGERARAQDVVKKLIDVPDYQWHAGCFGTGSGNLMGYWDRHGFPDFYTGPTGGGLAPLNSSGANASIRALWASQAGVDGRPASKPGHMDDYYIDYERIEADPYVTFGRTEHTPDCIGDFIGLSQRKWQNMGGECDGNIDAYSFVFWDTNGNRRVNYAHTNATSQYVPDIQSGFRDWTKWRGYDAEVFTQLADFNRRVPAGKGFKFEDLKREIDQGYPVLVFLQDPTILSRNAGGTKVNPPIHGMMLYGYADVASLGFREVYYRTSWGYGEYSHGWEGDVWEAALPARGFIGYRPKPKITHVARNGNNLTFTWHGPSSRLTIDEGAGPATVAVHTYQLYRASSLASNWTPVGPSTTNLTATIPDTPGTNAFYRLRLLHPDEVP